MTKVVLYVLLVIVVWEQWFSGYFLRARSYEYLILINCFWQSCLRCSRARRTCPGYASTKDRQFINYIGKEDFQALHPAPSEALRRVAVPDSLGTLNWSDIEQDARLLFFNDYCILSSNRNLSRGYLHGLRAMVSKAGSKSELVQACTLIALANLGSKLGNSIHRHRAESIYSSLLRSFRLSISNQAVFTTVESLITATLLGLYEVRSHE